MRGRQILRNFELLHVARFFVVQTYLAHQFIHWCKCSLHCILLASSTVTDGNLFTTLSQILMSAPLDLTVAIPKPHARMSTVLTSAPVPRVTTGAIETARVMVFIDCMHRIKSLSSGVQFWNYKRKTALDVIDCLRLDGDVDVLGYSFIRRHSFGLCALTNKAQSCNELWNFRIAKERIKRSDAFCTFIWNVCTTFSLCENIKKALCPFVETFCLYTTMPFVFMVKHFIRTISTKVDDGRKHLNRRWYRTTRNYSEFLVEQFVSICPDRDIWRIFEHRKKLRVCL